MYQDYKNVELVKPGGLELKDRLVGVQRVTKVTKGGRTFGFSAIVVVGDENGVVGQGLGKSKDVASAIAKAIEDAKKNLVRIPLNKTTLPHEQKGKYGGARVNLTSSICTVQELSQVVQYVLYWRLLVYTTYYLNLKVHPILIT